MRNVLIILRNTFGPFGHTGRTGSAQQYLKHSNAPARPLSTAALTDFSGYAYYAKPTRTGFRHFFRKPNVSADFFTTSARMLRALFTFRPANRQIGLPVDGRSPLHTAIERHLASYLPRAVLSSPSFKEGCKERPGELAQGSRSAPTSRRNSVKAVVPNSQEVSRTSESLKSNAGLKDDTAMQSLVAASKTSQSKNSRHGKRTEPVQVSKPRQAAVEASDPRSKLVEASVPAGMRSQLPAASVLPKPAELTASLPETGTLARHAAAPVSHRITLEKIVPPQIKTYGSIIEYDDDLNSPTQMIPSHAVDMGAIDSQIAKTHRTITVSGSGNHCWWRAAMLSAIVQRSPEQLENALKSLGKDYQADVTAIASMSKAYRQNGIQAILSSAASGAANRLKLPYNGAADNNEDGERACQRIVSALLGRAGVPEKTVHHMVFGSEMGYVEHVAALLRQLGAESIVSCGSSTNSGLDSICVSAQTGSALSRLESRSAPGRWGDRFVENAASLPIVLHRGLHFDIAIPNARAST